MTAGVETFMTKPCTLTRPSHSSIAFSDAPFSLKGTHCIRCQTGKKKKRIEGDLGCIVYLFTHIYQIGRGGKFRGSCL